MAVTENQLIKAQEPSGLRHIPVAASTTIYQGTLVFADASGYGVGDDGDGANQFMGVSREKQDNSSGSNGDKTVEVYSRGAFELVGSGFTQADVGKKVYASDNYTITLSATSTTFIGKVVEFVSSTKLIVELEPVID